MNANIFKQTTLSLAISSALLFSSQASAFVVESIELQGANRITLETIRSYLPFEKGTFLDGNLTKQSIERLYKTGFFKNVSLLQKGSNTLVIEVEERPSLSEIKIEGNDLIETDTLNDALQSLGIKKGRIFNQLDLDRIVQDLKRRYQNQGYYAARIEVKTIELPRNRVDLTINIIEGKPATIARVSFVGNEVYPDARLKSQMGLSESSDLGDGDAYSKPELEADLEKIKTYYLDRGFAEFKVRSTQVSLSNDKTKVFVTINIEEGAQYNYESIRYTGETIVALDELKSLFVAKQGEVFNRSEVIKAVNAMRDLLSEEGYAFAEIVPDTVLNTETRTVDLNFKFEPKNRVYIRYIQIEGNTRTRDYVIRRELRQLEGAPYSLKNVRLSKTRLERLGFFQSSSVNTNRVSADQVDLVVTVKEQPTGSFTAGVGYSQLEGASFNIGLSERNVIGSGNKLDLNIATSSARKTADIGLTNPYFTQDGVSLGGNIYYSEIDAEELSVADYTNNNLGFRLSTGYPLNETDRISVGVKFDSQTLVCSDTFNFCNDEFVPEYGDEFNSIQLILGWRHNSTNGFYFPTKGHSASINLETVVPGTSDTPYYKVYANESYHLPVTDNISFQLKGGLAFGDGYGDLDQLPFFENFYAGGIGTVRGFEPNSIGERYDFATQGSDRPKGGAARVVSTMALNMPVPFIEDSSNQRLSFFIDAGSVYERVEDIDLGQVRAAAGVGFSWITPVGPLTFSLARAIKSEENDSEQVFQFTLGTGF